MWEIKVSDYVLHFCLLQNFWTTVRWSRSPRRSSVAHARPWSARVTVETPLCTCAGTVTPACPWWTSVLLWRYGAVCHQVLSCCTYSSCPLVVQYCHLLMSSLSFLSWCLTFLLMFVFTFSSFFFSSIFVQSSPSCPPVFCLLSYPDIAKKRTWFGH